MLDHWTSIWFWYWTSIWWFLIHWAIIFVVCLLLLYHRLILLILLTTILLQSTVSTALKACTHTMRLLELLISKTLTLFMVGGHTFLHWISTRFIQCLTIRNTFLYLREISESIIITWLVFALSWRLFLWLRLRVGIR